MTKIINVVKTILILVGVYLVATQFVQLIALSNNDVIYDASTGLLPDETCPKWTLWDTANPENPLVSDGKLVISTSENSENMIYIQTDLTIPYPLIIEARVKRLSGSTISTGRDAIAIGFTTEPNVGNTLYIGDDEIFILDGRISRGDVALVDTDNSFHNYRIEVDSTGSIQVFYDDVLELTGTTFNYAGTHGPVERIYWGELSIWAWGTSDWELVKHNAGCTEIQVGENMTDILNNSGSAQFGTTVVGSPITKTFIISNTGQTDLTLTPPITVPTGFSIANSFGNTTLATGEQTTFIVQLDAISTGLYSGELVFSNNDADENPFNFAISGIVETSIIYLPIIVR